jgi:hypothetical protein
MCEYEWSINFINFIDRHPDKPWDWNGISRNPNITTDFIDKYPDKPWDWWAVSIHEMESSKIKFMKHKSILRMLIMYKAKQGLFGKLPMDVVRYTAKFI